MKKKINVLYDGSVLENGLENAAARSGVFFVAYNILLEMLKRDELNVTVYCDPAKNHLVSEFVKNNDLLKDLNFIKYSKLDELIEKFKKIKYYNKYNNGSKIVRFFIKLFLNLLKLIKNVINTLNLDSSYKKIYKDIDVFFSPLYAVPVHIKNIKSIKKYTILYDFIPILFPENYPDMKVNKSWFYNLIKSINKNDYYFAISDHTRQDYIKNIKAINPEHIATVPLSTGIEYKRVNDESEINRVKEKYKIPSDKKYLFSLCTLEPRKNLIFAVKNFIEFIKNNNIDDFVFVLGGGHWDIFIEKLNEVLENLDEYKDKIIKTGYVEDEDMSALYSGAEMFVFPSIYEGFGIPILEAMQCGCPVISSNVTSMPEVVGDAGILVNPTDNDDLINAFGKLYYDKQFKDELIQKGFERAKIFTWVNCIDVILNEMNKNLS